MCLLHWPARVARLIALVTRPDQTPADTTGLPNRARNMSKSTTHQSANLSLRHFLTTRTELRLQLDSKVNTSSSLYPLTLPCRLLLLLLFFASATDNKLNENGFLVCQAAVAAARDEYREQSTELVACCMYGSLQLQKTLQINCTMYFLNFLKTKTADVGNKS